MIKDLNSKWTEQLYGIPNTIRIVSTVRFTENPTTLNQMVTFNKVCHITSKEIYPLLVNVCRGSTIITNDINDPILYVLWHLLNWNINWGNVVPSGDMAKIRANPNYQKLIYTTVSLVIGVEQMLSTVQKTIAVTTYTMKEQTSTKRWFDITDRKVYITHGINYLNLTPDLLSQFYPIGTDCDEGALYYTEKMDEIAMW